MPQLDTVRAFAVFAVMFSHFYSRSGGNWFGPIGVHVFFVLSGFLITGILLREREQNSLRATLKRFYIRRSLRILPIYYLTVILTVVFGVSAAAETLFWNLTYTTNYYIASHGWIGKLSHFWSLAVEEQFYLFWPLLILTVKRKYLPHVIASSLLLANVTHVVNGFGMPALMSEVSTVRSLGWLGSGALLAYAKHFYADRFFALGSLSAYTILGLICGAAAVALQETSNEFLVLPSQILPYLFFVWLIHKASIGFAGFGRRIFEFAPLQFLGRISYGMYVYHNFMPLIAEHAVPIAGLSYPENQLIRFAMLSSMTIAFATLSWYLIEQPIGRLKDRLTSREESVGKRTSGTEGAFLSPSKHSLSFSLH